MPSLDPRPSRAVFPLWLEALALVVLGQLTYAWQGGRPMYVTDDDMAMEMIAAGVWLAQPSALVIFMHPAYGGLLRLLHEAVPGVAWHGWMLVVLLGIVHAVFYMLVMRSRQETVVRVFVMLLVTASQFLCLNSLQFTVVAGFATAAGLFCWLEPARWRLAGSLLVIIGGMLRFESALLAALLSLPVIAGVLWLRHPGEGRCQWRCGLAIAGGLAVLLAIVHVSARACYQGPEWETWRALNFAKTELIDNELVPFNAQTAPLYARQGWERTDYEMLHTWQFQDPERFSAEKMQALIAEARAQGLTGGEEAGQEGKGGRVAKLIFKLTGSWHLPVYYLTLAGALLLVPGWDTRRRRAIVLVLLSGVALLYYLGVVVNRLPLRISTIIFAITVLGVLRLSMESAPRLRAAWWRWAAVVLAAWALLKDAAVCRENRTEITRAEALLDRQLDLWAKHLPKDAVIYSVAGGVSVEVASPLRPVHHLQRISGFVATGWINQSPHQRHLLESLGLHPDFFGTLAKRPHAFLAVRNFQGDIERIKNALTAFYARYYRLELRFEPQSELPGLLRMSFQPVRS